MSKVAFPYKKLFMKEPDYYFDNLVSKSYLVSNEFLPKNKASRDWKIDDSLVYLCTNDDAYQKCNIITDYFTESVRIKCKLCYSKSPADAWKEDKFRSDVVKSLKLRKKKCTARNLREEIYKSVPECTNFKVSIAMEVYKLFDAKVVFDPFSGWGDRMIGAAAAGVKKYVSTDTNTDLVDGYLQIRKFLKTKSKIHLKLHFMPIEMYSAKEFVDDFKSDPPDLIFSSPPFFNFEKYSKADVSTSDTLDKYSEWRDNWFFPVIDRLWGMLAPSGNLAIHLSSMECNMATDLQKFMDVRKRDMRGVIACGAGTKKPLPILVWKKRKDEDVIIMPRAKK